MASVVVVVVVVLAAVGVAMLYASPRDDGGVRMGIKEAGVEEMSMQRQLSEDDDKPNTILDITVPYSPAMPVFNGDGPLGDGYLKTIKSVSDGDPYTASVLSVHSHTGTHIDAFRHFAPDGTEYDRRSKPATTDARSRVGDDVDALKLETLVGKARVVVIDDDIDVIDAALLKSLKLPRSVTRLLFKTRNSTRRLMYREVFDSTYVALSTDAAQYIVDSTGIALVGIDYLSIASYTHLIDAHRILLGHGIIAVEGLDLTHVSPGSYMLTCLPLRIPSGDGSPIRALLTELT